jgi:hypothetical protein
MGSASWQLYPNLPTSLEKHRTAESGQLQTLS